MADNKMLIDATHPEETRVVVLRGGRVEEFDYESAARKLLRGNIYLAKVTRVEPALQAAFVDYGGNRHGFLAFNEIHPDYYQIPMADRQALIDEEAAAARKNFDDDNDHDRDEPSNDARPAPDNDVGEANPHDKIASFDENDDDIDDVDTSAKDESRSDANERDTPAPESADENTKSIDAAAPADPKLTEDAPDISQAFASTTEKSEPQDEDGAQAEASNSTDDEQTEDDNGSAPANVGLVEDQRVEDVEPTEETADEETVEESGTQDALEEVPFRPRRSRRSYKIQEVVKRRQILLIQVVKEERGNKGAALTTYLSLAGRYTVLMPNTARGGGVSRKISSAQDRKRMKEIATDLEVPEGMGLIIRTAGASRTKQEIRRDFDYLLRLWESVRELTLESTAPSLVYEEGNLIKRSIRDLYNKDVEEIVVAGEHAYKEAKGFMRMLMPSHTRNVTLYRAPEPVFTKYQIERQLNAMFSPQVPLKSGGYLVINQTEALVAVDVNSGRSTREFSIEETALHTNLEAADEMARQLKLRDLAGLIVIDFIDMDEKRNNRAVERRMKEALRDDRARIQVGRISHFGLMEMSRQRMRTGVLEGSTTQCEHCQGTGIIRSTESIALAVLRGLEDAVMAGSRSRLIASTTPAVALYILNSKREFIDQMEARLGQQISIQISDKMAGANFKIEKGPAAPRQSNARNSKTAVNMGADFDNENDAAALTQSTSRNDATPATENGGEQDDESSDEESRPRRSRRRGRRGGRRNRERREAKNGTSVPITQDGQTVEGEFDIESSELASSENSDHDSTREPTASPDNATTDHDVPGTGPQPDPLQDQGNDAAASSDDTADEKPAKPRRSRRSPARSRRRTRKQTDDEAESEKSAESSAESKAAPTGESTSASLEQKEASTPDGNGTKRPKAKPASRRSPNPPSSSEIEITSVRVGNPASSDSNDDTTTTKEPATKKPARTGWWRRRELGED